jgi:hypothetical protein
MSSTNLNLMGRIKAKTPNWFKYIRNSGLTLTGISVAILKAPIPLPSIIVTFAGYCAVAGAIAAAISQTAVESE